MQITSASKICIILPKNATLREKFAASELLKYLVKSFGCEAKISTDSNSDLNILIGGPERNVYTSAYISEEEYDSLVPGPEGIFIKCFDCNTLVIAGSDKMKSDCERGTIYAVYEFLERYVGVSFAAYVNPDIAGGEITPSLSELELGDLEYIKPCADVKYRAAIVQYGDENGGASHKLNIQFLDWLVKNRYNRILTWCGIYNEYKTNGMLEEAEKRGLRFTVGHHSSSKTFLPPYGNEYFPEHYFETHPEYYKLLSTGERYIPDDWFGQMIFCSRNEQLISEIANNIIKWITLNPSVDIIAFWPQDGIAEQCTCEKCSRYSKVCNYAFFLNSIAKKVNAVHSHVKIDMLVYVDLWEPPEELKLEPSLIIDEATWHATGLRKAGIPDGSGIINSHFERNLLKWHKLGAEVVYYDYYMGVYPARQRYIPMADEIQSLCKRFIEKDILGSSTQIECFNMWNNIFNFYCFARTAYDTKLGIEDNLERFCRIFGNGANFVRAVISEAENCFDGQTTIMEAGQYLMSHIDKGKVYDLFDKALEVAEAPGYRNNIRMMRMAFRYSDLECQESILQGEVKYSPLRKYNDPTGELKFISRYDSYKLNNPGYGIMIPVDCPDANTFIPDIWYAFESEE